MFQVERYPHSSSYLPLGEGEVLNADSVSYDLFFALIFVAVPSQYIPASSAAPIDLHDAIEDISRVRWQLAECLRHGIAKAPAVTIDPRGCR